MKFVNRRWEIGFLNDVWNEKNAQFIIIYGKRRIGKSELALHFAKDKPHIYFLCERIPPNLQLLNFSQAIGSFFSDNFVAERGFGNWSQAFEYLSKQKKKMVLVIDEFPYLVEGDKGIPSSFQKGWDLFLKNSNIFLVLLGSSISMMEESALLHRAPLYGRRTGQILVQPFSFNVLEEMFPKFSFEERLFLYSVAGGTPGYLQYFLEADFVWEGIENYLLKKGCPLYQEVEFLLREELKEPRNYFAILQAISLGKHKIGEIINEAGLDKGTVSRYLAILQSLHIVQKEVSVTEKMPDKSRKGIYMVEDNFFNFWFQFIFRNRGLLEEGKVAFVLNKIKSSYSLLLSCAYEKIACEILKNLTTPHFPKFEHYGRWWSKECEIDLVAFNESKNEILFGEAKWSEKQVGTNIYDELKEKAKFVQWGKENRKEYYILFSKSDFTKDMQELAKKENVFLVHQDKLL